MHPRVRAALATAILSLTLPGRAAPPAPPATPLPVTFEALRSEDLRLAAIGYRLFTANAALCRAVQPEMGWALQAIDQFDPGSRPAARVAFGFESDLAVEAVVPRGPAERAGVAANDSVVSVAGVAIVASAKPGVATRNTAEARLAALPPSAPVALVLRRHGQERRVTVSPVPGCRSGIELVPGNGWLADSDGARIRVGSRWLERFGDGEVAVIVAHELAHTILGHRERLDAARVSRGLLAEVGRNGRLFRRTEDEADQLSVSLLYNAGYDPISAERFWHDKAPAIDGGIFHARTHRGALERAQRVAAERATIPAGAPRPYRPAVLATRDRPLS